MPLAGLVVIDGVKVGHLAHVAGACLGAAFAWIVLSAIGHYQVMI